MASCVPAKRPTPAPPTKKRAKIHGNAGRACSRSNFLQLALHAVESSAEMSKNSAAIYNLAGHDSGHWCSAEGAAVERRVARTAGRIGRVVGPGVIQRENRQVGGLIGCNFSFDTENARGAG